MRVHLCGMLAILLCLGQSCVSPGGDDSGDDSDDDDTPINVTGIPEGTYSGMRTTDFSLDNLSDALPPETSNTSGLVSFLFDKTGLLLRADDKPLAVGNTQFTDTQLGRIFETVTSITTRSQIYQFRTSAQLVVQGQSGLTWSYAGTGLYTFRLSGGKLLYEGQLDLLSDVAGGAFYEASWTHSATLSN